MPKLLEGDKHQIVLQYTHQEAGTRESFLNSYDTLVFDIPTVRSGPRLPLAVLGMPELFLVSGAIESMGYGIPQKENGKRTTTIHF